MLITKLAVSRVVVNFVGYYFCFGYIWIRCRTIAEIKPELSAEVLHYPLNDHFYHLSPPAKN